MEGREFDELDRRIVAALQVNGRASWRRIADVLGEPFRTVTRRGVALLESGAVRIAGLASLGPTHLVELECEPGRLDDVATKLAGMPDVIFVYALTSPMRLIVEVHCGRAGRAHRCARGRTPRAYKRGGVVMNAPPRALRAASSRAT